MRQASSVIKVIDWLATGWSAESIFPAGTFTSVQAGSGKHAASCNPYGCSFSETKAYGA
jgi:hypothetical protein